MITTNASKFVKRILDKLQHFKKVELTVSVDGLVLFMITYDILILGSSGKAD